MVSTYSLVPINSALAVILDKNISPVNGRGIFSSVGKKSLEVPPNAKYALLIASLTLVTSVLEKSIVGY